jgi:hypothetical protein
VAERAELIRVVSQWRSTCFRLESLDEYNVEHEAARVGAFLRGDPVRPFDQAQEEWLEQLRREQAQGRCRVRVHAIAGPLTPYLRYEIEWAYTANASAGEDIRILHRETWAGTPFGERPPDYYLLDDTVVAVMAYDKAGHWLGGEVITDPHEVSRYRELRDQAIAAAMPLSDYLAALRQMPITPPVAQPSRLRMPA